ncbi:hypothetical protein HW555_014165 [Spodoptera exigua]|uniref:P-type Ca(2+) transporter n=1 Tax=Spodoptera exigua TaxID=7107 RepID=A0A835G057_SPOEX|nr:hypothetical protein HW555_014165 [Spodoptera exigua]
MEEMRQETKNDAYQFIAVRLPYGEQADEADAKKALDFIQPDVSLRVNIKPAIDACTNSLAEATVSISDFNKGNMKARQRMIVQYAIAGEHAGAVIGTDHAAENITGFYTKYGDGGADILPLFRLNKRQGKALLKELGAPAELYLKIPTADLEDDKPLVADEVALGVTYDDIDDYVEVEKKPQTSDLRIPDNIKGLSDHEVQQRYAEGKEIHAKKTIDKLSLVNKTEVTVLRENRLVTVLQDEIVLGDVLVLALGNQVPSDGVVLHSESLEVDESLLTGESDKITKQNGDKIMSGSFITSGLGYVQITAVGEDNFVSKLSKEAKTEKKSTSELMNSLNLLIKGLTFAIVPIGLLLFWSQYQSTQSFPKTVLGVSGALISMIPEGLMLLTSVAFAVGAANLARKQTLIQRLSCIETLARVDTICLDKTGTITDGTLTFKELIPQAGFPASEIEHAVGEMMIGLSDQNATAKVLRSQFPLQQATWKVKDIVPFSSERKWSGVSFEEKGSFVMGAPEFIYSDVPEALKEILEPYNEQGDRVLILVHFNDELASSGLPQAKETVAIFIIADTIRENAVDTFSYFVKQDVTLKVISGDNPITVSQIAKQAGIAGAENFVDMSKIKDDDNFNDLVEKTTVFGRVTPYQKRELIQALKENGHTTCMTGDGVNDILSLREADVSVAMASGSDAARAVSDVVLLNSDFSSMIQVLNEGRRVINNIERVASMYMLKISMCGLNKGGKTMDGSKINGKDVTEEQLIEEGYRKYSGEKLAIYYSKDICEHIGNCVRGNPDVFEVGRRPWIIADNSNAEDDIQVINTCPSGALKYIKKG